jgi:hypothetical protein
MANRRLNQFTFSTEPMTTHIFAQVTIGASGAPTLNYGGGYISGIVRNSAGDYTLTFRDVWPRLLGVTCSVSASSGVPAAPVLGIKSNLVATSKTLEIVFSDVETPAATDPANGEILFLDIAVKNSTAQ